jgi:hypothetical protein
MGQERQVIRLMAATWKPPGAAQIRPYDPALMPDTIRAMNGLIIYVDWQYFLGILGALIGMAYYANGRFTKIETTVEWLKKLLLEIKTGLETRDSQASIARLPRRSRPRRKFTLNRVY